ncbi:hypothetical protein PILCRDRAFT_797730 [Piloderma croceum F 1598]|uniref:Ribosomal protein L30 ferredoxin-like fold domain-containing protein n=1 Tax=Piloderma croceum (strain F 1598) TaxID=765440 RepID=A0A0C3AR68_PILCF|nr:hypothetical protein PILCRDRAFT_797730 [Piloderma croceum F 1598]
MLCLVEPYITYGRPNLRSVCELIYKRGYGKINKQCIPLTNNASLSRRLGNMISSPLKTSFTKSLLLAQTSSRYVFQ